MRETAQYIWKRPCTPKRVGGVNLDGVVVLDPEIEVFVEITENRTLAKVREDVVKLQTAKSAAFQNGVMARCFCVVNGNITPAMKEAGEPHNIRVLSIDAFSRMFFDFEEYRVARINAPFGSAINPLTGEIDTTDYVGVNYVAEGQKKEVNSTDIAKWLSEGKKIILLGEYGTGKSRCIQDVFRVLSEGAAENFCYPYAVDLRSSWGLQRSSELLRRHVSDLGLDTLETSVVRAFHVGSVAVLLDGFDEIGSQAWSNDVQKLRQIRAKSLLAVKDTVSACKGGVLVTGREHYFPSSEEMFSALGMDSGATIVLRCKDEFSDTELLEYFQKRDIELDVPEWLPRRPLICQTITDLADDQFLAMFDDEGDEVKFWNHFITVLCERDARIHPSFDSSTIHSIFIYLSRLTRTKSANIGPISLSELQHAFESATGAVPVEEASVMLQRLPTLGRVSSGSNDRQFVDIYILDGLRAKDVVRCCLGPPDELAAVCGSVWTNPLDDLGQRVLARDASLNDQSKLDFARQALKGGNRTLSCDLIGALTRKNTVTFDFEGLSVDDGTFMVLNLREREISNIRIADTYVGELVLPALDNKKVEIVNCITPRVIGITSPAGLPYWIKDLEAEAYDSVASVSRIRRIGLKPAHEVLATVIRKTFFQKGSGRKEEALLRGLGSPATRNSSRKILNLLEREGLLTSFKGDDGMVYSPVRAHTKRMQKLLDELQSSTDDIWVQAGEL
ncbi:hypothetical protein H9Q09_21070 [Aurantimonas sp. DM33-3]|uniref:hypothetical protein n=1 Tax=Aurantimonas sp. DM33-3 TaxID=2766955 RepID=UPI001651F4E7|nr:hypothetical protein [Aurantimonas sp. DM33-3]MBC6718678.1 hypothetical protein [Aurantimonas sp. DM33-3]